LHFIGQQVELQPAFRLGNVLQHHVLLVHRVAPPLHPLRGQIDLSGSTSTLALSSGTNGDGSRYADYAVYSTADQSGPADSTLHIYWGP
jgi:hypothetical protein